MMQQVDLLADELKPRREPITPRQLLGAWLALVGVLLAAAAWQGIGMSTLADAHDERQRALDTLTADNEALRASIATTAEPQLITEVAQLRALFNQQSLMVEAVVGYAGRGDGFSGFLTDLAARPVEGVALQRIRLTDGGETIALSGETDVPINVPLLLKRLSDGDSFRGHRFDQLRLEALESGLLRFDIMGPAEETRG